MASEYKGLYVEFEGDTSGLNGALSKIDAKARATQRNVSALQRALKFNPGNTTLLAQQMGNVSRKIDQAKERLDVLRAAEQQIGRQGMSTEAWDRLQREIVESESKLKAFEAEYRQLAIQMGSSQSLTGRMGAAMTEFGDRIESGSRKVAAFGDAYTRTMTTGIVAGAGLAVKAAVDIDTSLTNVRKTVDGTEEQYQALKDAAIEFSKTNAVSASEILDIQALGAQLGFSIDELQQFGEVVSGLDIATNMDAETAATNMAQFANITGMAHDEIGGYASALVGLGNTTATTESDISNMSMRVAAAGTQIGMSEADILGLSATLASLGIEAEAGGTAISTTLSTIDKAVATNSDDLQAWAEMAGMSVEDFSNAWKEDATGAFQSVVEGMSDVDNLSVALEELGITGIRQTDVLKRLAGNTDLLSSALETSNSEWEKNSALSNEVANRNDSLAAKFEILKNNLVAVAAEVGEPIADALLEAVDAAQPFFDMIEKGARTFADLSTEEQQAALKAVAAVASLGPLLSVAGRVGASVSGAGRALTALSRGLSAINVDSAKGVGALGKVGGSLSKLTGLSGAASLGLVGVGVAAAGIAAYFAYDQWRKYQEHIEHVTAATEGVTGATAGAAGGFKEFGDAAVESAKQVKDETERLLSDTANMVDEWNRSWQEVNASSSELDYYLGIIDELSGKSELTAVEQERLATAVDNYNRITGDSVEVTNAATGDLSSSTEELHANADAWYANARAQAYSQQVSDLIEKQIGLQDELTTATQTYQDALANRDAYEKGSANWAYWDNQAQQAKDSMNELEGAIRANSEAQEEYSKAAAMDTAVADLHDYITGQSNLTSVLDANNASAADFATYLDASGQSMEDFSAQAPEMQQTAAQAFVAVSAAAESTGTPIDQMAQKMADAGISSEDLAEVGALAFERIYESADGNMELVKESIDDYNGLSLEDKTALMKANDSDFTNAIKRAQLAKIGDKDSKASLDNASFLTNARNAKTAVNDIPSTRTTTVNVTDNASGPLATIKRALDDLSGRTVHSYAVTHISEARNAAGGIAIPKHADGGFGVATRPTLTTAGWVGEDGWEAIVPLTNRRFVRPFAQAVAAEVNRASGGGGDVYNITANGAPDPREQAREIRRELHAYNLLHRR